MASHRTVCGKMIKFGTLIEDKPIIDHSKFEVSNSMSLAPPTVQSCTHVYVNNFWTVCPRNKILSSTNSLAQADSIAPYDVIFRHENFSAILNFTKNLLFRTPPRLFVRFSRKLNHVISRPCWQKVIKIKLIRQTGFDKIANEFDQMATK